MVLDTPPLSAFIDAAVLGSIADGTLLVVRRNFVRREEVLSSYEQLKKAEANVLGTVLNYCEDKKSEYYYEYYSKDGKSVYTPTFIEDNEDRVKALQEQYEFTYEIIEK